MHPQVLPRLQGRHRRRRAGAGAPSPFPLHDARGSSRRRAVFPPFEALGVVHPCIVAFLAAEPVALPEFDHQSAELALPATALGQMRREGVLGQAEGFAAGVGYGVRSGDRGEVLSQDQAGVTHDDEYEVDTHRPQSTDGDDAADALRLQDAVAEARSRRSGGESGLADRDGLTTGGHALIGCNGYVDMTDVVLRVGEAGCVVDGRSAGAGGFVAAGVAVVLGDDEEPGDAESGGVGGVDDAVEYVEAGEREAVEW